MTTTKKPSKKVQTTLKHSLYEYIVQLALDLELTHSQAIAHCVKEYKQTEKRL